MQEAWQLASTRDSKLGVVLIRVGGNKGTAKLAIRVEVGGAQALEKAIFGKEGMKDPKKFKVAGVAATVATKAQIGALLENSGWKVEVVD
eukprot:9467226-Alexandrium_andersonii.AAC.1